MYAFRLKLGPGTFTNDEVIYHDIRFIGGISTTVCSEREEAFFLSCGMQVDRVPVQSPEYEDARKALASKQELFTKDVERITAEYRVQIDEVRAWAKQVEGERDDAVKQLALNLELMELRDKKSGKNAKSA
jgi:hypothetical protein